MREATTKKWMALCAENARQGTSELFGIQNSLKNRRGQLTGLQDPAVIAKKEADEKGVRAELAKDPAKQKELGDAWDIIVKLILGDRRQEALERFPLVCRSQVNVTRAIRGSQASCRGRARLRHRADYRRLGRRNKEEVHALLRATPFACGCARCRLGSLRGGLPPVARRAGALARRRAKGGGEGGIRTPGTVTRAVVFKTTAIDRSATSPLGVPN
jgi:hypothetical protein